MSDAERFQSVASASEVVMVGFEDDPEGQKLLAVDGEVAEISEESFEEIVETFDEV